MSIGIGLYGLNGHQVHHIISADPELTLAATAGIPATIRHRPDAEFTRYEELDEMLNDDRVELVSLCSPVRRDQPRDAIKCLERGRHVYAEKPCALSEKELDVMIETAEKRGLCFHEMAGTVFAPPFVSVRGTVLEGHVGEVVQIHAQKSYLPPVSPLQPKHRCEDVRGGLIPWVGIHAVRMIEHTTRLRIRSVRALETGKGSPEPGGGHRTACGFLFGMSNGAVATAVANYLHRPWSGPHHNEALRVYGSKGFVEVMDGGARCRFVTDETDSRTLPVSRDPICYFHAVLASIEKAAEMPLSLEEELHPLRVVLRAKESLLS